MLITDIKRVVEQVSKDKGIEREVLIKALEEALKSAARNRRPNVWYEQRDTVLFGTFTIA